MIALPGIDPADVPDSCVCTYLPYGDRGPLAKRLRRIVGSSAALGCPEHKNRDAEARTARAVKVTP